MIFKVPHKIVKLDDDGLARLNQNFDYLYEFFSRSPFKAWGDGTNFFEIQDDGSIAFVGTGQVKSNLPLADQKFLVFDKASGNGIKVDTDSPTFGFRDLLGLVTQQNTGASKPTFVTYRDTLKQYQFATGKEEYFEFHIPHDYVLGTDIFLHIHWSHIGGSVAGGTITFTYEISYSKAHNQAAFPASVTGTIVGGVSTTQFQQILSETQISAASPSGSQIDTDNLEPDGVILCRLEVTSNDMTGTPSDPFIHYVDIHYQSTDISTKSKSPDFYS